MNDSLARLRLVLGWVVVVAWLCSIILDAAVPGFDPPDTLTALMMLVAGALFGPRLTGRDKNNKGHDG